MCDSLLNSILSVNNKLREAKVRATAQIPIVSLDERVQISTNLFVADKEEKIMDEFFHLSL